jgi:hypothetical protein
VRRRMWGIIAAGCLLQASPVQAREIKITDDRFRPFREYTTGEIRIGNASGLASKQLVGRVDRQTGALTTLLQFEIAYLGNHKRSYENARNNRAEPLTFKPIRRHAKCHPRNGCVYSEMFLVIIPEAELRQVPGAGYQIKAFARNGPDILVTIPKELIARLFAKIDADRPRTAGVKPATRAGSKPAPARFLPRP